MATEQARAVLGLNVTPFMRGIGKAESGLRAFGRGIGKTLGAFGLGLGIASIGRTLTEFADRLIDTSRKLGISTEFLQAWNHAAQQNGVSVNASNMALQRFSRRVAEAANGQGELKKTIEELGIPLRDNAGNMRSTTDILEDYADAIKGAESQQERLRLAFKAFDSEGVGMVNILHDGSDGLKQMTADAVRLGVVTEQQALRSINRLSNAVRGLAIQAKGWMAEAVGNLIIGTEFAVDFYKAFFGETLGVSSALDQAQQQETARTRAREILATQGEVTGQLREQADLERQKEASIKEQIRLQQAGEQAGKTEEEKRKKTFRELAQEQFKLNRQRETQARRMEAFATARRQRADRLEQGALGFGGEVSDPIGMHRAGRFRAEATQAELAAQALRDRILNPTQNIGRLQAMRRTLNQAAELEADAERARRFGFFTQAQTFESTAEGMRRGVARAVDVNGMQELTTAVEDIVGAMRELNQ